MIAWMVEVLQQPGQLPGQIGISGTQRLAQLEPVDMPVAQWKLKVRPDGFTWTDDVPTALAILWRRRNTPLVAIKVP